jgi:hypothetical protein
VAPEYVSLEFNAIEHLAANLTHGSRHEQRCSVKGVRGYLSGKARTPEITVHRNHIVLARGAHLGTRVLGCGIIEELPGKFRRRLAVHVKEIRPRNGIRPVVYGFTRR